jgi:hypothetical protein
VFFSYIFSFSISSDSNAAAADVDNLVATAIKTNNDLGLRQQLNRKFGWKTC